MIAIVAVLISVLLPSIAGARQSGQSVVAQTNVRQLAIAQAAYAHANSGWLAGPNTSGAAGLIAHGRNYEGATSSSTPTTTHDWISVVLGDELGLSPNRAERTAEIFERLACPRATRRADALWGLARDLEDFERVAQERGFVQVSYLAPSPFHYKPEGGAWEPAVLRRSSARAIAAIPRPYKAPARYRPRLDAIDRPGAKVLVADGTRYLAEGLAGLTLDFDVSPEPAIYGSFTSSGPIFHRSRAYGRAYLRTGDENVRLSVRYFEGVAHAAFHDTHAERLGFDRVWGDPALWYPRGSTYEGGEATPEVEAGLASDRFLKLP